MNLNHKGKIQQLFADIRDGHTALMAAQNFARWIDQLISEAYRNCYGEPDSPVAVFALGSYGRVELNPHSDIDILVVYTGDEARNRRQTVQFMQRLWDTGLEIGHQFVSTQKCCELAFEDPAIRTTLLEMRLVFGNIEVKSQLEQLLRKEVFSRDVRQFSKRLVEDAHLRHQRFGRSPQLLEPNVKEGVGGLRDLHLLLWLFRVNREWENLYWIKEDLSSSIDLFLLTLRDLSLVLLRDAERLRDDFRFLFRVRSVLHLLTQRKTDLLEYGLQKQVASAMGYEDDQRWLAVERFMRDYYSHARHIQHTFLILSEKLAGLHRPLTAVLTDTGERIGEIFLLKDGEIHLLPEFEQKLFEQPARIMQVFWWRQQTGAVLSETLREKIYYATESLSNDFRNDREAIEWFLKILRNPRRLAETLRAMHELRVFDIFLPEFSALTSLAQHDLYHYYSADEHTLIALENVTSLTGGSKVNDSLLEVYQSLPDKLVLFLAILFHDIGKALPGDHTVVGVEVARTILKRWQLGGDLVERVLFLIRNHQKMEQVAFRRNVAELTTVREFARLVGDELNLKLLYLLSYADLSAVNPTVWTEWKGLLIFELFLQTHRYLSGERQPVDLNHEALQELAAGIALAMNDSVISQEEVYSHLARMPVRYLDSFDEKQIGLHLRLVRTIQHQRAVIHLQNARSHFELTAVTTDQPFCLADICGVISVHDLNIFSAQIFTRKDGVVIDVFRVVPVSENLRFEDISQEDLSQDLCAVLAGDSDLRELFLKHKRRWKRRKLRKSGSPDEISFDNRSAGPYTIIDVFTDDSIGLLYRLALAMSELKLNIHAAKIATRVDQVADSFYVTDANGRKIEDERRKERIRSALIKAIHREF